jgi:hypothetical protein
MRQAGRRPWPPASGWVAALVVAALIAFGGAARLGEGTWAWRAGSEGARVFDGVPMVWEWLDVANGAWFLESNPRWTAAQYPLRTDQIIRFEPDIAVAILGSVTRDAWRAAVLASWLCWLGAAAAVYALCRALLGERDGRGHRTGCVAAVLVALSPGFTAYMGEIEARPFAYIAVAAALLALERARQLRARGGDLNAASHESATAGRGSVPTKWGTSPRATAAGPDRSFDGAGEFVDKRTSPFAIALLFFVANGTLELGPPLVAFLWLFYVLLDRERSWPRLTARARWALAVTLAYGVLDAAWQGLARVATLGRITVSTDNDAWYQVTSRLLGGHMDWQAVTATLWGVESDALRTFTIPVMLLLVPGLLILPRRVSLWSAAWIAAVLVAILLTRHWPRTLYLAYPAIYVAVAAAVERVGAWLARWLGQFRVAPAPAVRGLAWLPATALLILVGQLLFADLRGDLTLPKVWWPT